MAPYGAADAIGNADGSEPASNIARRNQKISTACITMNINSLRSRQEGEGGEGGK